MTGVLGIAPRGKISCRRPFLTLRSGVLRHVRDGAVGQHLARLSQTERSRGRSRGWIHRLPQLANFARAPTDGMDDVRRVAAECVPHRQPRWIILGDPDAASCIFPRTFRGRSMPLVCAAGTSDIPRRWIAEDQKLDRPHAMTVPTIPARLERGAGSMGGSRGVARPVHGGPPGA